MFSIVKEGRRKRYIGFVINNSDKEFTRSEMNEGLQKQCHYLFNRGCNELGIRLIRFNGTAGIIKCNHVEKENAIKLLQSIKSKKREVTTIATSGTIRSLMKKHMNNYL